MTARVHDPRCVGDVCVAHCGGALAQCDGPRNGVMKVEARQRPLANGVAGEDAVCVGVTANKVQEIAVSGQRDVWATTGWGGCGGGGGGGCYRGCPHDVHTGVAAVHFLSLIGGTTITILVYMRSKIYV